MTEQVIVAEHLTKCYRLYNRSVDRLKETFSIRRKIYGKDFYALRDVSFAIGKGETVGIIGQNGSGKSTVLKILTGVLTQTDGTVTVNGRVSALLELGAGFHPEYSGLENIYLNAAILNIPRAEMEQRVPEILAFADIGEHIVQPVRTYSSGMFVRLAFAVAIHVDPDILIVDEALAVGDTRFQLKCMDKFTEFMNAGKTVLFVSHDMNAVRRFCRRAIWLDHGCVVADGEACDVTDRYLDFLKGGGVIARNMAGVDGAVETAVLSGVQGQEVVAEIISFTLRDDCGRETDRILCGSGIGITIGYEVADESVKGAVLGVAIRTLDHKYICGVNTLLDGKEIPWKRGYNEVELTYPSMELTGGSYYFDAAIFDATATVPICYKSRIRDFTVKMDYIAEGIVVLRHSWNCATEMQGAGSWSRKLGAESQQETVA